MEIHGFSLLNNAILLFSFFFPQKRYEVVMHHDQIKQC